ncbi:MAG: hypothetical protein ACXWQ7_15185 [Bdellovibrio sp.]
MAKFNIPKREFTNGPKKMVSMRLPETLLKQLEKIAEEKGWTVTDLVITALDQFAQWETKKRPE